VQARVANPLGFKWDWPRVATSAPFLAGAAGGATFYELVWCDVEPAPGRLDWSQVDEVARSSDALGYSLLIKIRVGSCWATGGRGGHERGRKTASALPGDLGAYGRFVKAAVERYSARGVREYAIENEPNAPIMWDGTPEEYERLVATAAPAVHSANRDARVVNGGISSTAYGQAMARRLLDQGRPDQALAVYQNWYDRRFDVRGDQIPTSAAELESALTGDQARRNLAFVAADLRLVNQGVVSAWQIHFYERWDNVAALAAYLDGVLPAGFDREAWEVGQFWPDAPADQRTHAGEAAKTVGGLLMAGVSRVIWLPLAYNPAGRHGDEIRFGLLDPDGRIRPSGSILQLVARASEAGATVEHVAAGASVTGVGWARADTATFLLWAPGTGDVSNGSVSGPAPPGAQAHDIEGRPLAWGPAGLPVGALPVVVTGGAGLHF